jgi:hypothetical protein
MKCFINVSTLKFINGMSYHLPKIYISKYLYPYTSNMLYSYFAIMIIIYYISWEKDVKAITYWSIVK